LGKVVRPDGAGKVIAVRRASPTVAVPAEPKTSARTSCP
jgi:hypothetical protein